MKKIVAALSLLLCSLFAAPAVAQPLPVSSIEDAMSKVQDIGPFGCQGDPEGRMGVAAVLPGDIALFALVNADGTADVVLAKIVAGGPVYVWEVKAPADAKGALKVVRHGPYDAKAHGNTPCHVLVKPSA